MPCPRSRRVAPRLLEATRSRLAPFAPLVVVLGLLAAPPALAASGAGDPYGADEYGADEIDPTAPDAQVIGTPLSLAQAIALGLRNNLEVEINRYEPYIAELDAEGSWGAYDPLLSSRVNYQDVSRPPSNVFTQDIPNELSDNFGGDAALQALVPYLGATVGVSFDGRKTETNSLFPLFNPQYDSGLQFTADVPLLKGLLWNQAWTQVRTTKLGADAAGSDFETSVMNTVQGIVNSYWSLVAAKEQLRVAEKALETAQALLEQTQTQYDVGVVSKVEVVEAEAGVASRQFERIVARNQYQNANDALIATLLGRRLRAATSIVFAPTDNPSYEAKSFVDVERAVAEAFEKRPELRSFEDRIGQAKIQEKFARNQRLPDLSFEFRHRTLGIDGDTAFVAADPGDPNEVPPRPPSPAIPATSGNFGDSTSQFYSGNRDWTVGGRFSIPIPNTAARKQLSKAEFQLRRAESQRTQFKQSIIIDIRAAARGLIASAEGVEAAERGRVAAAEQLRAERIRLEHGESTPFDVLQRQNDLVSAESRKVAALQTYRDSQAALDRARGTILEVHDVQISVVRRLD